MRHAILILMLLCPLAHGQEIPKPDDNENAWTEYLAETWGGDDQHRTADGSWIDLVYDGTAWETEWPEKWKESIGQAGFGALATELDDGVILLVGRKPLAEERRYILRCMAVCAKYDIRFRTVDVRDPPKPPEIHAIKPYRGNHAN